MSRSTTIAANDLMLIRRDALYVVVMSAMPLVLMAFLKPAFQASLVAGGLAHANGAEQVVPGLAVLFGLILVGQAGWGVFQEYGWGTWTRLRASGVSTGEVIAGKAATPMLVFSLHFAVLFVVGGLVFDLHVAGSILGLAAVGLAWTVCLTALSLMLVALARSYVQLNALANIGSLFIAGLGGAITPLNTLPDWAQAIAPVSPAYWAMRGMRSVIVAGGSANDGLGSVAALLGFCLVFVTVVAFRFRLTTEKQSYYA